MIKTSKNAKQTSQHSLYLWPYLRFDFNISFGIEIKFEKQVRLEYLVIFEFNDCRIISVCLFVFKKQILFPTKQ